MNTKAELAKVQESDELFINADRDAATFSVLPERDPLKASLYLDGVIDERRIKSRLRQLVRMDVDEYIDEVVMPTQHNKRPGVREVVEQLNATIVTSQLKGSLYIAEIELNFSHGRRRIAIIGQERTSSNGAWMPEHHLQASEAILRFSEMGLPIVFLIDTPGADAGEIANKNNQAHSISQMITASASASVPTLGIVLGMGYSGGAIPLAAANLLLSVRDGVFNTIQPQGLQSIARKFNLSWQECAKSVGVSPEELLSNGCIDGIIDYTPWDQDERRDNLQRAMVSGIEAIEEASRKFVANNPSLIKQYQLNLDRYLNPTEYYRALDTKRRTTSPTAQPNIFGLCLRYIRYLQSSNRLKSISVREYELTAEARLPRGDLKDRILQDQARLFNTWIESPDKIVYDDELTKLWKQFSDRMASQNKERNKVSRLLLGEPQENYEKAKQAMLFGICFFLYNRWKGTAKNNFKALIDLLEDETREPSVEYWPELSDMHVLDIVLHRDLRLDFIQQCRNLLIFDALYDNVVANLPSIAREAMESRSLSKKSVSDLLEASLNSVLMESGDAKKERKTFEQWLKYLANHGGRGDLLTKVEAWKNIGFPQMNESLFVILTYFFETLLPEYYSSLNGGTFKGLITPVRIGRKKDFWNRLTMGYRDLLLQRLLRSVKKSSTPQPETILSTYFSNFAEFHADSTSANPVNFPGFHQSIEAAIAANKRPCGLVTGIGEIAGEGGGNPSRVGVAISNVEFQAGAFDMASARKFCALMVECAQQQLPIVCFISSGGMQTKEGAAALFSMAVVNDRITRFVADFDLPIVVFGFGDCTGGAQASFVTHPLVQTYYFSGCNMPFAGQMVVPSYLPSQSTLSNYLSTTPGAMAGLVKHPFVADLDASLRTIDPVIPLPDLTVDDVIASALQKALPCVDCDDQLSDTDPKALMAPVKKVLVHARGCTAVKLIRKAQENDIQVVLVASDPDMNAVPARMLKPTDRLVCIGGNSSDESYLNAPSIIKVAEYEQVDSLHPGIGFLSESPSFATLCVSNGINFVGPSADSMTTMGNKSNAVKTAMACGVPVVPGSHAILTGVEQAAEIADHIGYPVLLKAVHGGGGKGIKVVHSADEMSRFYSVISTEARSAFGSGDLYLEKFVTSMRHIEVQLLRDSAGNTSVLGIRDCTVQRDNQKVVEESGSTMLPAALKAKVENYTKALANQVDYTGAGTVEYIYDIQNNAVYFMEMNTRLQVEHPVTEATSGIDIVQAQFRIASGQTIEHLQPQDKGYAIEVRVTAEKAVMGSDGHLKLAPNPGYISNCVMPERDDVEIISIAASDVEISPYYDSLIAQIICRGESREDVVEKLYNYLDGVVIDGIATNIPLLKRILKDKTFRNGVYDTNYLPGFLSMLDAEEFVAEFAQQGSAGSSADAIRVDDSHELKVFAPATGVFYTAASPSDPDFVKPGDVVDTSVTLALVEAMKMFSQLSLDNYNGPDNELYPSDKKYRIEHRNVANGQQVSAGDLLFIISAVN
ncbi:biotin carboxylase N-terminal domain-containing protein [Pseudomaricurvus sp. HS19]|uniref:ATP-binding protein n=1 Tax=Pseudomaricurvus sp. HS19 TaxID=2692626 RepID=UPI00136BE502|nr:biotin carboxylase N-terminal domain-containing protein [Pseudomaricurvus sp. HS19]MYM61829.1 ATP-grasp domain-containing protein [Pseudomaricurvus sp. HS19]